MNMRKICTSLLVTLFFASPAGRAAVTTLETARELSAAADIDADGQSDLAIVDKKDGSIRVAFASSGGNYTHLGPVVVARPLDSATDAATGFSLGRFSTNIPSWGAIASPADGGLRIVSLNKLSPSSFGRTVIAPFALNSIGPSKVCALTLTAAGSLTDRDGILLGSILNGGSKNGALENIKITGSAVLQSHSTGLYNDSKLPLSINPVPYSRTLLDRPHAGVMLGTASGNPELHLHRAASAPADPLAPAAVQPIPAPHRQFTTGFFGAALTPQVLVFGEGSTVVYACPINGGVSPTFGTLLTRTFPHPVRSVSVIRGTGVASDRILVIFRQGPAGAALYDYDGANSPSLVREIARPADRDFLGGIGLDNGQFFLLQGDATSGITKSLSRHDFQGNTIDSTSFPVAQPLPPRGNVVFYSDTPLANPAARVVSVKASGDWSGSAPTSNPLPSSVTVTKEVFRGQGPGLGSPAVDTLGAAPAGARGVLANQFDANISAFNFGPALGDVPDAVSFSPAGGTFAASVAIAIASARNTELAAAGLSATQDIYYRIDTASPGEWTLYDPANPPHLAYDADVRAFSIPKGGGLRSPMTSKRFEFTSSGKLDSDNDGIPDHVEIGQQLDPSAGADSDGDGDSDLTELYAGTDPADASDNLGRLASEARRFDSSSPIVIPLVGNASPYPSVITVSGLDSATKLSVRINGLSHTYPADVDIFLVSPAGKVCAVLSDAGGADDVAGLDLTFDDAAASAAPASFLGSGSAIYQPTNIDPTESLPPGGTGSIGTSLQSLLTGSPNGDWKLYIADDAGGDSGSVTSWSLVFETASSGARVPGLDAFVGTFNLEVRPSTRYDNAGSKILAVPASGVPVSAQTLNGGILGSGKTVTAASTSRALLRRLPAPELLPYFAVSTPENYPLDVFAGNGGREVAALVPVPAVPTPLPTDFYNGSSPLSVAAASWVSSLRAALLPSAGSFRISLLGLASEAIPANATANTIRTTLNAMNEGKGLFGGGNATVTGAMPRFTVSAPTASVLSANALASISELSPSSSVNIIPRQSSDGTSPVQFDILILPEPETYAADANVAETLLALLVERKLGQLLAISNPTLLPLRSADAGRRAVSPAEILDLETNHPANSYLLGEIVESMRGVLFAATPDAATLDLLRVADFIYEFSSVQTGPGPVPDAAVIADFVSGNLTPENTPQAMPAPIDALRTFIADGTISPTYGPQPAASILANARAAVMTLLNAPRPRSTFAGVLRVGPGGTFQSDGLLSGPGYKLFDSRGNPFSFEASFSLRPGTRLNVVAYNDIEAAGLAETPLEIISLSIASLPRYYGSDSDKNLLADHWEEAFYGSAGLNPYQTAAGGKSLVQLYLDGADPFLGSTSAVVDLFPRQLTVRRLPSGDFSMAWKFPAAYADRFRFGLQSTASLTTAFADEYTSQMIQAVGDDNTLNLGNPGASRKFWRLRLELDRGTGQ